VDIVGRQAKMKKLAINILADLEMMTSWMQAADMFEKTKNFAKTMSLEYDVLPETNIETFDFRGMLEHVKKAFEEKGFLVTAMWVAHKPEINYVDWSKKSFSDGIKWSPLRAYLEQFGVTEKIPLTSWSSEADKDNPTQWVVGKYTSVTYRCPVLGHEVTVKVIDNHDKWNPNCEFEGAHGKGFITTACCDCGEVHKLESALNTQKTVA
jgi:hypothetical protein